MGFFSWNCNQCEHPLLSPCATNEVNAWMTKAVVQYANGTRLIGDYDGYGHVEDIDLAWDMSMDCQHYACWVKAGKPAYQKASKDAADQGFFFDDPTHNMREPA